MSRCRSRQIQPFRQRRLALIKLSVIVGQSLGVKTLTSGRSILGLCLRGGSSEVQGVSDLGGEVSHCLLGLVEQRRLFGCHDARSKRDI